MLAQLLWMLGAIIFLALGTLHLLYTFFTDKFSSRNAIVIEEMKRSFPKLTNKTTIWKAWIGFNASHSSGAIFIGIINLLLAFQYFEVLRQSVALQVLNIVTVLFYLFLGQRYWFNVPRTGILLTCICFIVSAVLM